MLKTLLILHVSLGGVRARFYRELIQAAVQSTRIFLLGPDIKDASKDSEFPLKKGDHASETTETWECKITPHLSTLAHFRALFCSLKNLLKKS